MIGFIQRHRLALSAATAILIGLILVVVSYLNTEAALDSSRWVAHTEEVISALERTLLHVVAAETAQRAYVITGDEAFVAEVAGSRDLAYCDLNRLRDLVADNAQQTREIEALTSAVRAKMRYIDRAMMVRRRDGFDAARQLSLTGAGHDAMLAVRARTSRMTAVERDLLQARTARAEAAARRTVVVLTIGSFLDVFLIAAIVLLVLRDFDRGRELRRALTLARDSALQAAEVRAQFLANMSHEIRTPLNAIVGMSGLLMTTDLDDDQRDLAQTVRTSADALLTVINDILDFSKIEAGKLLIENADLNLRNTVEAVIDLFSETVQAKGLEIGVLFDHGIPSSLRGDAGRIRQVLTNLVGNAVKFTAEGEVIVHLNVVRTDDDVLHIRFAVTDTGIGISEETLARLFQPFAQADASTTRKYGGTGLGLAISKQLVELMGGTLGAESAPGKGSTFWFILPLERSASQKNEEPVVELDGLRVLIVDDNSTNRRLLRHNLESWRMLTDEVESAEHALSVLRNAAAAGAPYPLAIVDMLMPVIDGLTLARSIRADASLAATHIIMLTSLSERLPADVMRSTGIDATLTKPVKQSSLFDAIVSAMAGKESVKRFHDAVRPAESMRDDVRVLVAEDNAVNQKVALRQLQRFGIAADAVGNGAEALEALGRMRYDLVLMDVQMPEMDGLEATRAIRAREAGAMHTPIVALTANALEGDRERCLAAGMDDYLSKPVAEIELARVIDRWVPARERAPEDPIAEGTVEYLRELGNSDENFFRDLVAMYEEDAAMRIEAIRRAIAMDNASDLASAAHALKSSAGNVGATMVRALAEQLETTGRSGSTSRAAELASRLETEHARAVRSLREHSA